MPTSVGRGVVTSRATLRRIASASTIRRCGVVCVTGNALTAWTIRTVQIATALCSRTITIGIAAMLEMTTMTKKTAVDNRRH